MTNSENGRHHHTGKTGSRAYFPNSKQSYFSFSAYQPKSKFKDGFSRATIYIDTKNFKKTYKYLHQNYPNYYV